MERDTALLIGLAIMVLIGITALVTIFILYRRAIRDKKVSDERAERIVRDAKAVVTAEQALLSLREQVAKERKSPVPDLTLIRGYERQITDLQDSQRRMVENTPWSK